MLHDLIAETVKRIEAREGRTRSRGVKAQACFTHAVTVLLTDLWHSIYAIPQRECSIQKRSGYYSETPRYRDQLLTYKQTIAAFDGLLRLGFIEVTREGYLDRETGNSGLTLFVAKDELLERLKNLSGHPAISGPILTAPETVILRDKVDGKKVVREYKDTPATEQ